MPYYMKKPVRVEAHILTRHNVEEVARWCGGRVVTRESPRDHTDVYVALDIPTLEGVVRAETVDPSGLYRHGDAVIRSEAGEFSRRKPATFYATYDLAGVTP